MMILGIDRETTTAIIYGMCPDTELLNRYELLHKLVTGRSSGVLDGINEEEDIRVKIAKERQARNARIKEMRRRNAARLAGVMA